jgi:uncharacterized protein YeaO (DUF488 family)
MRARFNSELSPSPALLIKAGIYEKNDGTKNPKMGWREYEKKFIKELYANPKALDRLLELKRISLEKTIFLVCLEKDPANCHRSIVKKVLENITEGEIPRLDVFLMQLKEDANNKGMMKFFSSD